VRQKRDLCGTGGEAQVEILADIKGKCTLKKQMCLIAGKQSNRRQIPADTAYVLDCRGESKISEQKMP
jgi:hypothetical protein